MLARYVAVTSFAAFSATSASAETPFAAYCEGNICYQRKVQMGCLRPEARRLLNEIANRFGKIEVASVCDGRHARRSAHYVGKAIDFRPFQATRAEVVAFLKAAPNVGGVGTYSNGLIHADVADRKMAWHGSGRGRVVWPIGAGTIERAPGDPPAAPTVVASAFSFPFSFLSGPTPSEGTRVASAGAPMVAAPDATPLAASLKATLPPLPPRRPAFLSSSPAEQPVSTIQTASTDVTPVEIPLTGEAALAPATVLASMEMAAAPAAPTHQTYDLVEPPSGHGSNPRLASAPPPLRKGFDADESVFSSTALAPDCGGCGGFMTNRPFLISSRFAPY